MRPMTDVQRRALVGAAPVFDFGVDLLDAQDRPVEDISADVVSMTAAHDLRDEVHGDLDLGLTRDLVWGVDRVRPWVSVWDGRSFDEVERVERVPGPVRYNLAPRPRLVDATTTNAPFTAANTSMTSESSGGVAGSLFVRWTTTAPVTGADAFNALGTTTNKDLLPKVEAGQVITASAWVRSSVPMAVVPSIPMRDAAGAHTGGSPTGPVVNLPAGQWRRIVVTATVPDGIHYAGLRFGPAGPFTIPTGVTLDMSAFQCEHGPVATPYLDGGMSAPTHVYSWLGAPGASPSIARQVADRANLAPNPRAMSGRGGWSSNNGSLWKITVGVAVEGHPQGITTAAEGRVADGVSNSTVLSAYNLGGEGQAPEPRSYGVWVKVNMPGYLATIVGNANKAPLAANTWTFVQTDAPRTGWGVIAVATVSGAPAAPEARAWITGAISTPGDVSLTFFDGDTPATPTTMHAWTGTPGASPSIAYTVERTVERTPQVHRWPLGVYLLTTPETQAGEEPRTRRAQGYDKLWLLRDEVGDTYTVPAGATYLNAIRQVLVDAGVTGRLFLDGDRAGTVLEEPAVWVLKPGGYTWLDVANGLLGMIGYDPLWVDAEGAFRSGPFRPPAERGPAWRFDATDHLYTVVGEERTLSADAFDRPNYWRFFRKKDAALTADDVYVVDRTAGARPRRRVESFDVADRAALVAEGDRIVAEDTATERVVTFETVPLPWEHGDVAVVTDPDLGLLGAQCLVRSWTTGDDGRSRVELEVI